MAKLRPPVIAEGIIRLDREPGTPWIDMAMPSGDTYSLDVDEFKIWMRSMRIDEDDSRSPLDRVWAFYHIEYDVVTQDFKVILAEELLKEAG